MPDWLVHIGVVYVISKILRLNIFLALIGALLPDLTWSGMWFLKKLGIPTNSAYSLILPYHTPFMTLIMSLTLSSFLNNVIMGLISAYFGAVVHLLLDVMEYGNFVTLLYPFDVHFTSLNIFALNSKIGYFIQFLSSLVLSYGVVRPERIDLVLVFREYSLLLIPFLFIVPLITYRYVMKNFPYFSFIINPEQYDGKKIFLVNREIISTDPLTIDVIGKKIYVDTNEQLNVGDFITVKGVYDKDKNILLDTEIHLNNNRLKQAFSILGVVFLVIMFLEAGL